jgi:hypothetical protein
MIVRQPFTLNIAFVGKDLDHDLLLKSNNFISLVYSETVEAIRDAAINRSKTAILFKVAYSEYQVEINKSDWKKALNQCIEYHKKDERYEQCSEIVKLIKELEL